MIVRLQRSHLLNTSCVLGPFKCLVGLNLSSPILIPILTDEEIGSHRDELAHPGLQLGNSRSHMQF